ncbi:transposase [Epilithonimonas vandammei]|uniref:transposase n=1 Tax=Epilithonimonas vandammei TaxID=2487072 RepID=UPI0028ABC722|nr:transposase [Epilithonimonas vandammei]
MNKYNPQKHHRRSIRLQGYDYSQEGLYFITICCQDRTHLFGEIVDGKMILNSYGEIAQKEWQNTSTIRDNVVLHEFVVMPNHFHSIIEIKFQKGNNEIGKFQSPSQTVGAIIRGYKIATIKKIKDFMLFSERDNFSTGELQFAPTAPTAPTEKIKELDFKIWQRNYYEHIIRNEEAYARISDYIRDNPKRWNEDKFYGI